MGLGTVNGVLQDVSMACLDCGSDDPSLQYRSGRMSRCYDCQNYWNLTNTRRGAAVTLSREEFLAWKASRPRACAYCGITGEQLIALAIINPRNRRPYESIGVDRIDNAGVYSLDNIVPCCGPCNAIRGGVLTFTEMESLGESLRKIWDARLQAD